MNTKSLRELSAEYRNSADLLTELIERLNRQLHKARNDGNGNLEYRLKKRIYDLYGQREHMIEIATHLNNYYKAEPVGV